QAHESFEQCGAVRHRFGHVRHGSDSFAELGQKLRGFAGCLGGLDLWEVGHKDATLRLLGVLVAVSGCQIAARPPSPGMMAPWMKLARWLARKTMASAISSTAAGRPAGAGAASWLRASFIPAVPSVKVGPGLTALTRTPWGPYSAAQDFVIETTAALLAP